MSDCDDMKVIQLASLSQWLWYMSLQQNVCWITWRRFSQFIQTSFDVILLLIGLLRVEQPGHVVHSPPSSTKVKMRTAIPLLPLNAFMAWTGTSFTWRIFLTSNWLLFLIYILFHAGRLQQTTPTTQVGGCGHLVSPAGAGRYWEDEDVCTAASRPWAG